MPGGAGLLGARQGRGDDVPGGADRHIAGADRRAGRAAARTRGQAFDLVAGREKVSLVAFQRFIESPNPSKYLFLRNS